MNKNTDENKIEQVVAAAMENLQKIISSNTVLGTAVKTDEGDFLYPVSKICFGFLNGGGEYGKQGIFSNKSHPFSAGNGAIVYVKPCGFLIKSKKGDFKVIAEQNSFDYIVDKAIEIVESVKGK